MQSPPSPAFVDWESLAVALPGPQGALPSARRALAWGGGPALVRGPCVRWPGVWVLGPRLATSTWLASGGCAGGGSGGPSSSVRGHWPKQLLMGGPFWENGAPAALRVPIRESPAGGGWEDAE